MALPQHLFGTLREHYILLFGAAGGLALAVGFLGAWFGARFGARMALRRSVTEATEALASRAEVRAVSDDLQALLVEVERIAEGQRFVSKLLAEREQRAALPPVAPHARREPGEITPH